MNILAELYNACNPLEPAKHEYYVDCSDVRGSNAIAIDYQRELSLSNGRMTKLFSGHIGCGKSSELEHVSKVLRHANPPMGTRRYFPVVLRALEYLDEYDVTPTDILLAIVAELGDTFREQLHIDLKDSYVTKRLSGLKDSLLGESELAQEINIGIAKASIKRLQKDPVARIRVREQLMPHMSNVLQEINGVFDEARIELKKYKVPKGERPYDDLLLIVDDLEKIQRLAGVEEGQQSQHRLFIERSHQLTSLNTHVIFTVPLALVRSEGARLTATYSCAPTVLPMIKVSGRETGTLYEPGRQVLTEILQKRLRQIPLNDAIEPDALDWIITYSGGHVRNFLTFIQRSATYVDAAPVTLAAAKRSMNQYVGVLSSMIRAKWWPVLVALDRSPTREVDNNDPGIREMLEQNIILEYLNGGDETDPFGKVSPWYGVNPIVRELPQFKANAETGALPIP